MSKANPTMFRFAEVKCAAEKAGLGLINSGVGFPENEFTVGKVSGDTLESFFVVSILPINESAQSSQDVGCGLSTF